MSSLSLPFPSGPPGISQPSFTPIFVPPTASFNTPSSTPTDTSQTSLTSSAALYLYTFLATLVLLLAVSSAIVIRSLILRRRHQRLVEEAIRAGTWVPNQYGPGGRRRRDIGEKPRLWDAWIQSTHDDEGGGSGSEKGNWGDIMPVCAARIDQSTSSLSPRKTTPAPLPGLPVEPQARPSRFLRPFQRRLSPPSPQPVTILPMTERHDFSSNPSPSRSPPSPAAAPAVRVAVLIAMPSPPHHPRKPDEDGPPVVELGVVEVGLREEGGDAVPVNRAEP